MRQWHQNRPGCIQPMPDQPVYGRSQTSGGIGLRPSQLKHPSTASQNLPQLGTCVALLGYLALAIGSTGRTEGAGIGTRRARRRASAAHARWRARAPWRRDSLVSL